MSTKVKTEKVTLYRVTWPANGETWAEQRVVVLDDVDKNHMFYRVPKWGDVAYEHRHRLAACKAMWFDTRDRLSRAQARRQGVFETADDAKRWVWEALRSLSRAKQGDRGYFLDKHNRHLLCVSDRWPKDSLTSLDEYASAVDGLKVWTGE